MASPIRSPVSNSVRRSKLAFGSLLVGFSPAPSRRPCSATRRYVHAALRRRPNPPHHDRTLRYAADRATRPATASTFDEIRDNDADFGLQETDSKATSAEGPSVFADHLNNLFAPLKFPPQLAKRILTHGSHPDAFQGHNAGLSFLGRRVLESYLLLMLSSSPRLEPSHDLELVVTRTLNTYALGEHVGSRWGLGRVMLWTPTVSAEDLQNADVHAAADIQKASSRRAAVLRSAGLYKVEGDAVTAVMGGIYYQHGASVAHRVFHTRLLPHILLGREATGLPWTFHRDALDACEHYGGLDGPLVSEESIKVPLLS